MIQSLWFQRLRLSWSKQQKPGLESLQVSRSLPPVPGAGLLLIHIVVASHRPPRRLMASAACREEFLLQFAVVRLRRPSEMEYQAWRTVDLYTQFCCLGPCHVLPKHGDAIFVCKPLSEQWLVFLVCVAHEKTPSNVYHGQTCALTCPGQDP